MYRLITCDLDETLLKKNRTIDPKDIEAIHQLKKLGIKFVPATGRGVNSVQGTLKEIGLFDQEDEYVLSYNGGMITENKNSRVLFQEGLDFNQAEELYTRGLKCNVCMHVYTPEMVYIYHMNEDELSYIAHRMKFKEITDKDISFLKGQMIVKVLYENTDFDYLKEIEEDLKDITGDIDVSFSSNRYIEFNHAGVNKGAGLKTLASLLNIDIKDTAAIGDNFNDLSMIQASGLGIGVQNTIEGMKRYCDAITDATCDEAAVSEAIHRFILKDKE